jgi:hypothetical protein
VSKFSRAQYEILAEALKAAKDEPTPRDVVNLLSGYLCGVFASDNERFDKERFLKAAGLENY